MKKIIGMVLVLAMLAANSCMVFADEAAVSEKSNLDSEKIIESEDNAIAATSNLIFVGYASCTGDGVKLKSAPSASGTTLGLMYRGERLRIYNVQGVNIPPGWSYVYREKTAQYGYMSSAYYEMTSIASINDQEM